MLIIIVFAQYESFYMPGRFRYHSDAAAGVLLVRQGCARLGRDMKATRYSFRYSLRSAENHNRH
jgi:hypothetical protein